MSVISKLKKGFSESSAPAARTWRNQALTHLPKRPAHLKLKAECDLMANPKFPHGRPESLLEYGRRITEDGKDLLDFYWSVYKNEPSIGELIVDELGRPRMDPETNEPLVKWSFPSWGARLQAAKYLGEIGLLPKQPTVNVSVSGSVNAPWLDNLSLDEQRTVLALMQKGGIPLPSSTPTAHEDTIEGQVLDNTDDSSTDP